jgi:hypothetical protein
MIKTPSKSNEDMNKQVEKVLEAFDKMSVKDKEDFVEKVKERFNFKC